MKRLKKIIPFVVAAVILLVFAFVASPTLRSLVTGIPVHFRTLDKNSTRSDVIALYGEPVGTTSSGKEIFEAEFLSVKGRVLVDYFENTDHVFTVQFRIQSNDYDELADYEHDVRITYRYFEHILSWLPKDEAAFDDEGASWSNDSDYIAYKVYAVNDYFDEQNEQYYDKNVDVTVFQFNTYTEEMKQWAEDLLDDIEDAFINSDWEEQP